MKPKKKMVYPFDEFWGHFLESSQALELEKSILRSHSKREHPHLSFYENLARLHDYMETRCKTFDELMYKFPMFMLIMSYVAEHIHDFDEAEYAVVGSPESGTLV